MQSTVLLVEQGGGGPQHAIFTFKVDFVFMPGLNSTADVSTNRIRFGTAKIKMWVFLLYFKKFI